LRDGELDRARAWGAMLGVTMVGNLSSPPALA
jgi:hypothetical protein